MIKKIEHIGVAVRDLESAIRTYRDVLEIPMTKAYESEYTKAKIAFFPLEDCTIELIQPTDSSSLVAKFIERKGEGIHHLCLGVKDFPRHVLGQIIVPLWNPVSPIDGLQFVRTQSFESVGDHRVIVDGQEVRISVSLKA